jgi:hypothetical protein
MVVRDGVDGGFDVANESAIFSAMTKRRSLYPMPVDELFRHPKYVALPVAGRGMLLSALEHFWRSDCAPLPTNDDGLFAIVRAHRSTWRHHKDAIMLIFNDVKPGLEAYHRKREGNQEGFRIAGYRTASTRRLNASKQSLPDPITVPTLPTSAHYAPKERHTETTGQRTFRDVA